MEKVKGSNGLGFAENEKKCESSVLKPLSIYCNTIGTAA